MRTFIIGILALAIYAPLAFGQDAIPLEQAISSGKVEAAITGIGGSTGDAILITVRRRTPDLLRLTLTPGTVFKSVSGAVQNMAGASIKGQRVGENSYRPETEIVLMDNYTRSYVIEAYCLDFHKGNPGATDRFDIAPVDGQAARLLAIGKDKPASIGAIQAALWMLREGLSPAQVQARFPVSSQDITVACSIVRDSMQEARPQPNPVSAGGAEPTIQPEFHVNDIVVTLDHCVLQNGQAIRNLPGGAQLRVIALNGDWVGCSVLVAGTEEKGWLQKGVVAGVPQAVSDIKRGDVVVALENTPLRLGERVLAEVPTGARLRVRGLSGDWADVAMVVGGREQEGWVERRFVTIASHLSAYGGQPSPSVYGSSIINFDNQSGDPALVRLVGPTRGEVFVPSGGRSSLTHVAAGNYTIHIRYGTPGRYRYTQGDHFDVQEGGRAHSWTTITLHTVVSGNYGSRVSSEDEFNQTLR
jgi:hypothetical protein